MAITLLTVVQRVCRNVSLDPTITAFSETDETKDVVQDVAEAYEELLMQLPNETTYLFASGAITTTPGLRTYALASDAMSFDLYAWSFLNQTESYSSIKPASREFIQALDPQWSTKAGIPQYVYQEGANTVAFYPVPSNIDAIAYQYGKTIATRISATSDTFVLPDRWVRYVEKRAQAKYERRKGFADPDSTDAQALVLWYEIMSEAFEDVSTTLIEEGF